MRSCGAAAVVAPSASRRYDVVGIFKSVQQVPGGAQTVWRPLTSSLPPCPPSVPLPPAGVLRITDVTHSTMRLSWDAAPGAVRKYIVTYKPEDGDLKEVRRCCCIQPG